MNKKLITLTISTTAFLGAQGLLIAVATVPPTAASSHPHPRVTVIEGARASHGKAGRVATGVASEAKPHPVVAGNTSATAMPETWPAVVASPSFSNVPIPSSQHTLSVPNPDASGCLLSLFFSERVLSEQAGPAICNCVYKLTGTDPIA